MTLICNIKKTYLSILLLGINFLLSAQDTTQQIGLIGGLNFPTLELNEESLRPEASSFLGVQVRQSLSESIFLRVSGFAGRKKSRIGRGTSLFQENLEVQVQLQKKFDQVYFNLGLVQDIDFGRSLVTSVNRSGLQEPIPDLGNGNDFYINLGTEFELSPSFNFLFQTYAPFQNKNTSNVQFGLVYKIRNSTSEVKLRDWDRRVIASKRQIKELDRGTLLIRLYTAQPKIDAMKKAGLIEESKQVEEEQRKLNLNLIKSFRAYYSFSDVQFFYSYSSNQVREKNFNNIFLNDQLEIDSNITINEDEPIYTGGFQNIERDSIAVFDHEDRMNITRSVYFGGTDYTFTALVIMDNQFQQLDRPFPYYTRAMSVSLRQNKTFKIILAPLYWKHKYNFDYSVRLLNTRLSRYSFSN